jgi:S1-C subfamily serine protease
VDHGIMISSVTAYGPAQNQNLGQGLVITEADRKNINDVDQFKKLVKDKEGSAILLKVKDSKGTSMFIGLQIPKK